MSISVVDNWFIFMLVIEVICLVYFEVTLLSSYTVKEYRLDGPLVETAVSNTGHSGFASKLSHTRDIRNDTLA